MGIAFRARQNLVGLRPSSGTDNGPVDAPGANVRLIDRGTGKPIGVLALWSRFERGQTAAIKGQEFEVGLRFERLYKPYSIYLYDIQQNNYSGTTRARDFRAIIKLTDAEGNVVLDRYPIWMNNPLRYAGETFYQSEIKAARDGNRIIEATQLQVVKNEGWMAPYVACMIVAVGMCFQFVGTLLRFLDRMARSEPEATSDALRRASMGALQLAGTYALPVIGALVLGYLAQLRPAVVDDFHVGEFGRIPVVAGGRPMPIDALARNRLMLISDRQTFKPHDPDPDDGETPGSLPATYWLLEMAARPEEANHLPVFRIENDELTRSLGMEVSLHRTYSFHDFEQHRERLFELAKAAVAVPAEKQTVLQRKQVDLFKRIQAYDEVQDWFLNIWREMVEIRPSIATEEATPALRMQAAQLLAQTIQRVRQDPARSQTPLLIPTQLDAPQRSIAASQDYGWESFQVAAGHYGLEELIGGEHSPAMLKFLRILDAWKDRDAEAFNRAVADYNTFISRASSSDLTKGLVNVSFEATGFEEYFNRFSPFNALSWLYLGVLLATLVGWMLAGAGQLGSAQFAHRSGMWLAVVLLLVHTWAIGARIYISGKPPVTNLYSSAVFIGWAAVVAGIVFERIFGRGFGNIVSAASGFMTLRIAYGLMSDGDTLVLIFWHDSFGRPMFWGGGFFFQAEDGIRDKAT